MGSESFPDLDPGCLPNIIGKGSQVFGGQLIHLAAVIPDCRQRLRARGGIRDEEEACVGGQTLGHHVHDAAEEIVWVFCIIPKTVHLHEELELPLRKWQSPGIVAFFH